mgnify:FL=1|jgi:hypothetical protein
MTTGAEYMGEGAAITVVRLIVVGAGLAYWEEREEDGADRIDDAEERPPPLPPERAAMISVDPKFSCCWS